MTNTERIERLEKAIKEIYDILEDISERTWPDKSKVEEIVSDLNS
jgi:t-SNARE complex subunit (syntaxin)